MGNTIDEAYKIKLTLDTVGIHPKGIMICTGELHGPSAKLVYRMFFPESRIFISTVSYRLEIQPDHPVLDQRTMNRWILSNVKRQAALRACYGIWKINRPLGLKCLHVLRKIKHKAAN